LYAYVKIQTPLVGLLASVLHEAENLVVSSNASSLLPKSSLLSTKALRSRLAL
jgi:hypothetical protein